jgi:hypothetical protein
MNAYDSLVYSFQSNPKLSIGKHFLIRRLDPPEPQSSLQNKGPDTSRPELPPTISLTEAIVGLLVDIVSSFWHIKAISAFNVSD